MSTATAIDEQGAWRRIPAFRAWLVLTVVLGVIVLVLLLVMLSREPEAMFGGGPPAPARAESDETLAEAGRLRVQAEATAQKLRDVLRSVAAYECPAGTVVDSPDRFEAIRQRAVRAVGTL